MTLAELTTLFKARTGRLDLADADIALLINRASVLLDQLDTSIGKSSRFYASTVIGVSAILLPAAYRWLDMVRLITTTSADLLTEIGAETARESAKGGVRGTPTEYAKLTSMVSGVAQTNPADYPTTAALAGDPQLLTSYLLLSPVPNAVVTIEVTGVFFSPSITATVLNRWATNFPDTLIQACQYLLTKDLLNIDESTKLLADLTNSINLYVFDSIMDENISHMEG